MTTRVEMEPGVQVPPLTEAATLANVALQARIPIILEGLASPQNLQIL